jgi:dienelactone hydrolase
MPVTIAIAMIACVLPLAICAQAETIGNDAPLWEFPQLPVDRRFVALQDLDQPATFTPVFQTRAQREERAAQLRRQVLVAAGLWPMPARPLIQAIIWGRIERDGYTIEKVYFASRAGHYVSGNLYRPTGKTGPFPAVLTPHGHWENGRLMQRKPEQVQKELDSGAEQTKEGATYPLQARCAGLARMGCVVFIYDMVGVADSAPIPHADGFRDAEAELRLQSSFGLQTWNSIRALDFLCALPDVDPKRIAVTGESGGGTQTIILSAIDDRVAVSVPVVMVSGNMQGGCICENASLLRVDTNNIELAALFAPKPLCAIGADDWTSDIETVGYPELQQIYGLYGATPNVPRAALRFPAQH